MAIREFRAHPVQAVQWLGEENCLEVFEFLGWEHPDDEADHSVIYLGNTTDDDAKPGDWIIRDHEGAFRSLTGAQFTATYVINKPEHVQQGEEQK